MPQPHPLRHVAFRTPVGPMGVVMDGSAETLIAVRVGFGNLAELTAALLRDFPESVGAARLPASELLCEYAAGVAVDFSELKIAEAGHSEFRAAVTKSCRCIPRGRTVTYAELAELAGYERKSARPVGGVMRRNPWPIVVPCHRVTPTGGGLGNYSAPLGGEFKRRLLELEAAID